MALALAIPAAIGGALGGWLGALTGLLWGGLVRQFLTHHVTWNVNSICHTFGKRAFETNDASRNEWIVGLLAFGEGWQADEPTDFPPQFSRSQLRTRDCLFHWRIDSVTIRQVRPVCR